MIYVSENNAHSAAIVAAAQRAAATKSLAEARSIMDAQEAIRQAQIKTHPFNNQAVIATVKPHIENPLSSNIKEKVAASINSQNRKYV
jgi:hypothetical protein